MNKTQNEVEIVKFSDVSTGASTTYEGIDLKESFFDPNLRKKMVKIGVIKQTFVGKEKRVWKFPENSPRIMWLDPVLKVN